MGADAAGVVGAGCWASAAGARPPLGAGANWEKFGGAGRCPGTGAGAFGTEAVDAGGVCPAVTGLTCGGRTLTDACCTACGRTVSAAGATAAEAAITFIGTTVAALRFTNCWLATCGGGSAERSAATIFVMLVILVALTLAMLTFSM